MSSNLLSSADAGCQSPGIGRLGPNESTATMKKRFTKEPHRGTRRNAPQQGQRLRKRVQELYAASPGRGGEVDLEDAMQEELEPSRRGGRRPDRSVPRSASTRSSEEGQIVGIASGQCSVERDGEVTHCRLPSRLAQDQQSSVAVGDRVRLRRRGDGSAWVAEVLPRRTALSRPDPQNPRRDRVIAANVDIVVHVASVVRPTLRPALIDRYLAAIERSGADPLVCISKIDLLEAGDDEALAPLAPYRARGLSIVLCSSQSRVGVPALRARLAGKTAVFVGHSGVGKSSLLNALAEDEAAMTGAVSRGSGKGRHTTTGSALYELPGGIRVIDTPGIRELGLRMDEALLERTFSDIAELAAGCRFSDCAHGSEPDCAVTAAIAAGRLDPERLATFQRIRDSLDG